MLYTSLAIAPVLAICIFVYWRDKFEKEPLRLLVFSYLAGCLSTIIAAGIQLSCRHLQVGLSQGVWGIAIHTFLVVGLSEEFAKFFFLKKFYKKQAFSEPYDGITYAVMVSMGFATVENLLYVLASHNPVGTAVVRMFTAVPAHATFGVLMGYWVGLAKFRPHRSLQYQVYGLLSAVFFHGAYDFFLYTDSERGTAAGAVISLVMAAWLSLQAIKIHTGSTVFVLEGIMPEEPDDNDSGNASEKT